MAHLLSFGMDTSAFPAKDLTLWVREIDAAADH